MRIVTKKRVLRRIDQRLPWRRKKNVSRNQRLEEKTVRRPTPDRERKTKCSGNPHPHEPSIYHPQRHLVITGTHVHRDDRAGGERQRQFLVPLSVRNEFLGTTTKDGALSDHPSSISVRCH